MEVYAGYYNDEKSRINSSSGAVVSLFAKSIISDHGVVYGVKMSKGCRYAEYSRVDNILDLSIIQGSKYMQARVKDAFLNIKNDLLNNRKVLFIGTACQINGLKNYLKSENNNLFCIDIICHGAPSSLLWQSYIDSKYTARNPLKTINFRSKEAGWYESGVKENDVFTLQKEHPYMTLFLKDIALRPSCYECVAKENKLSDITVGDLWGVHEVASELNDDKGISVIIVRTKQGIALFERCKDKLIYKELTYEEGVINNSAEYSSVKRPSQRNEFYTDLKKMKFDKLYKKYIKGSIWIRVVKKVKHIIKTVLYMH